jgi:hypothetical protein
MRTTEMPEVSCPYCEAVQCIASSVNNEEVPDRGSISICADCGEISIFNDFLRLRRILPEELVELQGSPEWVVIAASQEFIRKRRGGGH